VEIHVQNLDLTSVLHSGSAAYDSEGDYIGTRDVTVGDLVVEKLVTQLTRSDQYPSLTQRIREVREEEIRDQIRPTVERVIAEPVQRTNGYGQPTGNPVTLTELILAEAKAMLTAVDTSYGSRSGDKRETVIQRLVRETVDKAIRAELAEVIAAEKAKVVTVVRARAAELIAESIKAAIK